MLYLITEVGYSTDSFMFKIESHLHFFSASSVVGFRHPVSFLQPLYESEGISPRVGSLTPTEDLPHCHTIGPLHHTGRVAVIQIILHFLIY